MRIMDVNSPVRNAKSQKLSEEWNSDPGRNRLGNLPEGILLHILSFLPTEDSVKTSTLSKRWQCLWMSVPNLEFSEESPYKRKLFMNFVERVLMLRDPSNIQKFTLSCCVLGDESRINAWVSAAVRHKVQALDLSLCDALETPVSLPSSLFTCASLTELNLFVCDEFTLPSIICFSSLKIMSLDHVIFWDDHLTRRLFSGCPVLEKLTLNECYLGYVKSLYISAPMLGRMTIIENPGDDTDCKVVINGTSLQSFNYRGELIHDYCLCNSSSLMEARLDMYEISYYEDQERQRKVAERTHKLLRGLHNARKLILSCETFEVLDDTEELLADLPMFSNLTFLKVTTGSLNFACEAMMKLLQNSPSLNTMQCLQGISLTPFSEDDDWILDPMLPCFLTHLKTIEIGNLYGTQVELYVIKSLLKSATALEKMGLSFRGGLKEEYKFIEQLGKLRNERTKLLVYKR